MYKRLLYYFSGRDEEDGEVDEDDEDKDDNKNRKKVRQSYKTLASLHLIFQMKSSIVDTTNRRKSSISKDEINEAQIGGAGRIRVFFLLILNLIP